MTRTLPARFTTYVAAGLSLAVAVNVSVLVSSKREFVASELSMSTRWKPKVPSARVPPHRDTFTLLGTAALDALQVQQPERPIGQKIALVTLLQNDIGNAAAEMLWRTTRQVASMADYRKLLEDRLVIPQPKTFEMRLTPQGDYRARQIARDVAHTHGLHYSQVSDGRFEVTLTCTCGDLHATLSRNAGHIEGFSGRAWRKHIDEVAAGPRIPRRVKIEEIMQRVARGVPARERAYV